MRSSLRRAGAHHLTLQMMKLDQRVHACFSHPPHGTSLIRKNRCAPVIVFVTESESPVAVRLPPSGCQFGVVRLSVASTRYVRPALVCHVTPNSFPTRRVPVKPGGKA